jgi:hypothetical protein
VKLKSKSLPRVLILFLFLSAILVVLTACSTEIERLWLEAPGWSRAQWVGDASLNQAVSLAVDDRSGIYLLAIQDKASAHYAHVIALNRRADIVWERTLDTVLVKPDKARILWDGQELDLFWLDEQSLYAARLDTSGNVRAAPALLSGETSVGSYDVASDSNGSVAIWYGGLRRKPGVYALSFKDPTGETTLVDAEGIQPAVQYDNQGTLHVTWIAYPPEQTSPRFYYAAYPRGLYRPEQQTVVTEPYVRSDSLLQGPWLGLDRKHVYLFWIEVIRSGRQMNQLEAWYVYLAANEPGWASEPGSVALPRTDELLYETLPEGGLAAGQRVSLASGQYPLAVPPSEITVNAAAEQELVLALRAQVPYRRNSIVSQVSTLFLQDGVPTAYQLLTFTPRSSLAPAVVSDEAGYLYLTWIERKEGTGFQIYFASTAPDVRQTLSSVTREDVGRMVADTLFGLLKGAVFSPFAAMIWFAAPLLVLALTWAFRRGGESLVSRPALISMALALLAYWAGKLVTFARARTYVPFSAWVPVIPAWLQVPLQLGVPIVVTLVALKVAWRYANRSSTKSAALFAAIYAGVDSLFTMAVYGGLLYDAF